ncbi:MAG: hypothetical protein ACI8WT_004002 [Clostridium sp.]|jgi:hypothetical protein
MIKTHINGQLDMDLDIPFGFAGEIMDDDLFSIYGEKREEIIEKKDNLFTENQRAVVDAFITNEVSESHYLGEYGSCRFSAMVNDIYNVPIINKDSIKKTEGNIRNIIVLLMTLPVKPTRLYIDERGIEVEWCSKGYQILNSILDYFTISFEFANLVDACDFCNLKVNTGSLVDELVGPADPNVTYIMDNTSTFSNCFGDSAGDRPEIIDVRNDVINRFY